MSERATVLIHGLGSSPEHGWERTGWMDLLRDAGREPFGIALPGHPGAGEPGTADVLDAVAAELPEGETDIVAFSAGAIVALALLAREPRRVGTAVLLGIGDGVLSPSEAPDLASPVWQRLLASSGATAAGVRELLDRLPPIPGEEERAAITSRCVFITGALDPAGAPTRLAAPIPRASVHIVPGVDHFGLPGNPRVMSDVMAILEG